MSIILITGAAGRIGRALCANLVLNHQIIALDRPGTKVSLGVENPGALRFLELDLEHRNKIFRAIEELRLGGSKISGIVHAAGLVGDAGRANFVTDPDMLSECAFESSFKINAVSLVWLITALSKYQLLADSASVVAINSIYGSSAPDFSLYENTNMQNPVAYAASKHALHGVCAWLSKYFGPKIRVNSVSPGGIESSNMHEQFVERYLRKTISGKMLGVDDVVPVIKFLLGNESRAVYGQNIIVDGGFSV